MESNFALSQTTKAVLEAAVSAPGEAPARAGKASGRKASPISLGQLASANEGSSKAVKEAKVVLKAFKEVAEKLNRSSLGTASIEEKMLVQKLMTQLENPASPAARTTKLAKAHLLAAGKPDSKLEIKQNVRAIQSSVTEQLLMLHALQNAKQLAKPQAAGLQDIAPQMLGGCELSQDVRVPLPRRTELMPRSSDAGTASQSFIVVIPEDLGGPAKSVLSAKELLQKAGDLGPMKRAALIKSNVHGLNAPHNSNTRLTVNGKVDDGDIRAWGLLPRQEVQGEHLTSSASQIMSLGFANVPSTVAMRVTHKCLGAPNPVLAQVKADFQVSLSDHQAMKMITEAGSSEVFTAQLENMMIQGCVQSIHENLLERLGVVLPREMQEQITNIVANSLSLEEVQKGVEDLIFQRLGIERPADFAGDSNNMSKLLLAEAGQNSAVGDAILELTDTSSQIASAAKDLAKIPGIAASLVEHSRLNEGRAIAPDVAAAIYREVVDNPTANSASHLVSIQQFMEGTQNMRELTGEQRQEIGPLAYVKTGILDGLVVQRDRNPGNLLTRTVSQDQMKGRIDAQLPGLGTVVERAVAGVKPGLDQVGNPHKKAMAVRNLGDQILAGLPGFSKLPAEEKLKLEFDVHQLCQMMVAEQPLTRETIPIDNAMSFPNPLLILKEGEFGQKQANNSFIFEPASQLALLPSNTRVHLQSLDIMGDVLPKLRSEHNDIRAMATPDEEKGLPWTVAQEGLFVVSAMIIQKGAQLDKTAFEMALMKDQVALYTPEDAKGNKSFIMDSPLFAIYQQHFIKDGQAIPLHEVDLNAVDRDITNGYATVRNNFGSISDGFAAWNNNPDITGIAQTMANKFYPK
ncbi:MAG: hypothetical protein Q8K75_07775 [Chlamydiales bacterium]|nr:hypothetical protein [Chlamydiales bacterium]